MGILAWLRGDDLEGDENQREERALLASLAEPSLEDALIELLPYVRHSQGCPAAPEPFTPADASRPFDGRCQCGLEGTLNELLGPTIVCGHCGRLGDEGNTDGWVSKDDGSAHLCEGCAVARFG